MNMTFSNLFQKRVNSTRRWWRVHGVQGKIGILAGHWEERKKKGHPQERKKHTLCQHHHPLPRISSCSFVFQSFFETFHPLSPNHEREFPIPGIPGNTGLQFPSRKSGMEFATRIPVPENGNGIFHLHSRSRKWEWNFPGNFPWILVPKSREWNFPLTFPFPKFGNGICHSRSHSRSPKLIPAHPCHTVAPFPHNIYLRFPPKHTWDWVQGAAVRMSLVLNPLPSNPSDTKTTFTNWQPTPPQTRTPYFPFTTSDNPPKDQDGPRQGHSFTLMLWL